MRCFRMYFTINSVILVCWLTGCVQVEPRVGDYYYYDPFDEFRYLNDRDEVYQTEMAECRQALENDENDIKALYHRGILYAEVGRYQVGITDLTKVVSLVRADSKTELISLSKVYVKRGLIHWQNKDVDSAIDDFSLALEREPSNSDILFLRWQAFLYKGDPEKARVDRLRGMTLQPDRFEKDYGFRRGVI